jgi:hypothetical protein
MPLWEERWFANQVVHIRCAAAVLFKCSELVRLPDAEHLAATGAILASKHDDAVACAKAQSSQEGRRRACGKAPRGRHEEGIGRGEAAMESFLQANGVQRQAYFGGAFVGNHVEKLLRNLDKLWIILEETAAQMDREAAVFDQLKIGEDSGERQARGCRVCRNDKEYSKAMAEIKDRVSPYWAHFEVFHHECRKTRLLSAAEVDRLCSAATGLVKGAREAYPKTHVELKLHVIEGHVEKFVRKWRSSGLFLEDAVEHYHALDNSFNRRFSCLHGVRKAQSKHNALAIIRRPDIISRSADRATRRQRHFVTPRAPKSA